MLRAVVADLHVGQSAGDVERFARLCGAVAERGVRELVLLGDLFRTLVGYRKFWDDTVRQGLNELLLLRGRGLRVVLVEGNRDFFLDAPDLAPFLDAATAVHSFSAGGRRFLLEHGDLVNSRDRAYHFWRAVSKSAVARLWARLLPARLARGIVGRTERRLAGTNFEYRKELPEADLGRHARRHFAAGVDVVMWGHFHRTWRLAERGREAMTLPAWGDTGELALVRADGGLTAVKTPDFVDAPIVSWYEVDEAVRSEAR